MPRLAADDLRLLAAELLVRCGAPLAEAGQVADHLVEAGLCGHDTHGLLRLPQYVDMVRRGQVRPGAPLTILSRTPGAATVSGGWNFGAVSAAAAVRLAIELTDQSAVGVVTVRECNHVARLGSFAAMAAAAGRIGMVGANGHGGDLAVAPHGGRERRLPTNPLSIAVPTGRGWPFLLDMTTSALSGGALRLWRNTGRAAPAGLLIDAEGQPTTQVEAYYRQPPGAILPLGSPANGHKGLGLAMAVDILAGALSGAGCSRGDAPLTGNGLFILVLRPEAFLPLEDFAAEVDRFIDWVKSSAPAPGYSEVLVPGEGAHRTRQRRLQQGVDVDEESWARISRLAAELAVDLPTALTEQGHEAGTAPPTA